MTTRDLRPMRRAIHAGTAAFATIVLASCTPAAPSVTATQPPAPAPQYSLGGSEWDRFRDDPRDAFVFASAYEIIWGYPVGNGETARTVVKLAYDLCETIRDGTFSTWDALSSSLAGESDDAIAEKMILTAKVYCPEVP